MGNSRLYQQGETIILFCH
uniref:Uncharacterized protein n=1 Tax=Anguilla anguilla TaxID=7936 RepID=A0A0E9UIH0_ANGAN